MLGQQRGADRGAGNTAAGGVQLPHAPAEGAGRQVLQRRPPGGQRRVVDGQVPGLGQCLVCSSWRSPGAQSRV